MRQTDVFSHGHAHQCDFCNENSFAGLLFAADQTLLKSICEVEHCLHLILRPVTTSQHYLRERGHEYLLPDYKLSGIKESFLLRHLFQSL
jgi:hypothetical protein